MTTEAIVLTFFIVALAISVLVIALVLAEIKHDREMRKTVNRYLRSKTCE